MTTGPLRTSSLSPTPMSSSQSHGRTIRKDDLDQLGRRELISAAREYAKTVKQSYKDTPISDVQLSHIDWEASSHLYRAGAYCETKLEDPPSHTIVLSYPGYEAWGWKRMTGVIRHELGHVVVNERFGDEVQSHGPEFREVAEALDAPLRGEEPVPYRYKLYCSHCGSMVDGLYQASVRTKNPWDYTSDCCKAPLQVETAGDWR